MITLNGKTYIKRYLAAQVPSIGSCIAYGLGTSPAAAGDSGMHFEMGRADVTLTSYDFTNDRVIFKATLPDTAGGEIHEVALWSTNENSQAGNFSSKLLASFDSDSETWVNNVDGTPALYSTEGARIGADALNVTPAAGQTVGFILNDLVLDLSGNSGADVFKFAYNVGLSSTPPASITVRFRTDSANYYYYVIATPGTGYHIDSLLKGNALVNGTPNWSSIIGIEIIVVAGAAGAADVDFDGIRIEDTDSVNPDYVMIAREVLATPYVKVEGQSQEVEFSLKVYV